MKKLSQDWLQLGVVWANCDRDLRRLEMHQLMKLLLAFLLSFPDVITKLNTVWYRENLRIRLIGAN